MKSVRAILWWVFLLTLGLALGYIFSAAGAPWHQPFTPARTIVVSNTAGLIVACSNASPGDLYLLRGGTYTGSFSNTRGGTMAAPVVFRAYTNERVTINGGLIVLAPSVWIWGLEITDPTGIQRSCGVVQRFENCRVINCWIHDLLSGNGLCSWSDGGSQVFYGNSIHDNGNVPVNFHGIYSQNSFASHGWKYIVNNFIADPGDTSDSFTIHSYAECSTCGPLMTGLWMEKNAAANGHFLIGGYNDPPTNCVIKENWIHRGNLRLGYARPTQGVVVSNVVARGSLVSEFLWGLPETKYQRAGSNIYVGNLVVNPADRSVKFRVSSYPTANRCDGCGTISGSDVWDYNQYVGPFTANCWVNNSEQSAIGFDQWRSATQAGGNRFDQHSQVVPMPTGVQSVIWTNDYEYGRAHIVIYNWSHGNSTSLSLDQVMPRGRPFSIRRIKEHWGTPVVVGTNAGLVSIPLATNEFQAFLLLYPNATPPVVASAIHGRMQVMMQSDNRGRAQSLIPRLNSMIAAGDKNDKERKNVEAWMVDEGDPPYLVQAEYIFADDQKGLSVFQDLSTNPIPDVRGTLTFHFCPEEGAIPDWGSCLEEPRAQWRTATW